MSVLIFISCKAAAIKEADSGLGILDVVISSPWEHFDGKGFHSLVPEDLQANGKIQNLMFTKKEVDSYIDEIWMDKSKYDADTCVAADLDVENAQISLTDFFALFLLVYICKCSLLFIHFVLN